MEKLGSRIKRLRKEKGVKQSFLHDNQSAVSQIERGFNENPSPELLRKVAENLEITFEELVKGTSWSAPKDSNSEGKYGYSELDFELTLSEAGRYLSNIKDIQNLILMDWKIDFVQILQLHSSLVVKVVKNQFNLMNRYFVWDVVRRYFVSRYMKLWMSVLLTLK